ncbi:MAG TPA: carboxypeptidase-like regulatory domain-containing protein [Rhodothermales bacterium]|nr:carboxypeptidase-like regulatory domain-containing protein [Rhodothermales bacterium]
MRVSILSLFALFLLVPCLSVHAQSGKIAGQITDAATGEALPGVNVLIEGTSQGTISNAEGYYVMLNVAPGTVILRASFIGFTPQRIEGVRVNIDQTTTVDIAMREETLGLEEVVVTAERPVVQRDVSNSQANITAEEIQSLPVSSVSSVVGLQAGVQGLSVRGSGSDELSFMVNGLTLQNERNNAPYTTISLASIEEVQVQTGGFNAEYGNVRSGVINVVTKEGQRDRYTVDVIARYSPPAQKHFGAPANDLNSYWIRPYVDPAVAFTGTENGAWDEATQQQYPTFEGWVAVAEDRLTDDDPTNDLSPEALQQAFLWQHRKQMEIVEPDYDIDVGIGGPIPGLRNLGNTRFYASFRRDQDMYLIPLHTDRYEEYSAHLKVTSDIARGMKLSLEGRLGEITGTASSRTGQPGVFRSAFGIASQMSQVSFIDTRIFSTDYWTPTTVKTNAIGLKFTHALSPTTFYEVRLNRFASDYDSNPGRLRDETSVVFFGGVGFDEAPFGFQPRPTFGVDGMRTGVGMSNARDTSQVTTWNLKADITSQLNRYLQVKSGIEYNLSDSRINYGSFDEFLPSSNSQSEWDRSPVRGAAYAQSKLEFKGMIANVGLRLDYFHAGGEWITFNPFTQAFSARLSAGIDTLLTEEPTDHLFTLSPRVGVSFPVTDVSKLYFNYGHFRSMPDPNNLYLIEFFTSTGQVNQVANPNNPLPKTVAYELGYEQSLLNQFLVRVAGYYKDISLEPRLVNFISRDGQSNYFLSEPNNFADTRGFEVTLARNRGRWVRGFINYTYMVTTSGYFGFRQISENPTAQREFENSDTERRRASSRPVPRPYARLNLDFFSPGDFGPALGPVHPLGDVRVSFIGSWQDGGKFTWTGGGSVPGVLNNVDFRDSWNVNLRFSKMFDVGGNRLEVFADVFNLLNRRQLSFNGFVDGNDQTAYLQSLHFPASPDYPNIPGDDVVGDYREEGIAYVPMTGIQSRDVFNSATTPPDPNTIYYEFDSSSYIVYQDGAWGSADAQRVDQVLEDKAYIDMPNQGFLTFLNPRDVYWGIRLSF